MGWRSLIVILSLLIAFPAVAGDDFAPIPPAVWAIKDGPKGAVVLEDRMRFAVTTIDYLYRVRIFAEAGKEAAEIADLPQGAIRIKGRTIYPDGRQVQFNSRKDFAERRIQSGSGDLSSTHLVAPGVTTDCVVEFSWSEPANGLVGGLPRRLSNGLFGSWVLANAYPTQVLVIEVGRPFPLAWSLNPGGGTPPESSDSSGYRRLTFRNVAARETPPYSIRPTLRLPTLVLFWQPENLRGVARNGGDEYWKESAKSYIREDYEEAIDRGGAYKTLSKELTANLPPTPVRAATELLARLDARIANLWHATYAESALIPKDFWDDFKAKDLAKAAKIGKTNGEGMRLLFFHLLRDAGLNPKLAKVPDRDITIFDWSVLNLWQFNKDLLGIDEPGVGTVWFDPTLRFATPGVVHPDYTAVPALIVDTKDWKPTRGTVGGLVSSLNTKQYTYALDLSDEGDGFSVNASFSGYPEFVERNHYLALEPKEQSRLLKEQFEKALKNLKVELAEVKNTSDAKASVTWQLKGMLERESGRNRVVDPFPGMPWPLWVPAKLEESRTAPIVLPYLSTQVAVSTFKVPKGYTMGSHLEIKKSNSFGKVSWLPTFDESTGLGKVTLQVEVTAISSGPNGWSEFKTFLSWVEEVCRLQVTLSKAS